MKGRDAPDWFLDCPELLDGERVIMKAFWVLTTERQIGGKSIGPIPWSAIVYYGTEWLGLDRDALRIFLKLIRLMDVGYLNQQRNEHARATES